MSTVLLVILGLAGLVLGVVRVIARLQRGKMDERLVELGEQRKKAERAEDAFAGLRRTMEAKHEVDHALRGGDDDWRERLRRKAKAARDNGA